MVMGSLGEGEGEHPGSNIDLIDALVTGHGSGNFRAQISFSWTKEDLIIDLY